MLSSVGLLNDLEVMRIVIISYSCKQKNTQQAQIIKQIFNKTNIYFYGTIKQ